MNDTFTKFAFFSIAWHVRPRRKQVLTSNSKKDKRKRRFIGGVVKDYAGYHFFESGEEDLMIEVLQHADVAVGWDCRDQLVALGCDTDFAQTVCDLQSVFQDVTGNDLAGLAIAAAESYHLSPSEGTFYHYCQEFPTPTDLFGALLLCRMEADLISKIHKHVRINRCFGGALFPVMPFDPADYPAWPINMAEMLVTSTD